MSTESVRDLADRLGTSSRALAALAAALGARVEGTPLGPAVRAQVDAVLDALGVRQAVEAAGPAELRPLLGAVRSELFLGARLASGAPSGGAWSSTDPAVLRAAGDVSAGFPGALERAIAPRLDGLTERLRAADAAFLDVGVGVAAMAVEMARRWPSLRVVGIDPWAPALALARDAVREAGLEGRIELREGVAEALEDEGRFDLAWVPSLFIAERALPAVLGRVGRALRPGGWVLVAFADPGADPLAAALTRLRTALWGGTDATAARMEAMMARAGLVGVRTLPGPAGSVVAMAAGRQAEEAASPAGRGGAEPA
jgi:SAM-dependent methyltransferase